MYLPVKRFFDILISLLALLIVLPVFIPICLLLLVTGEHVIFYRQKRLGYKNKMFGILKFATMLKNSPNIGTGEITLRNDPRVTRVGSFLRKTKINELPQLINVLIGEMSIVGPRPQMQISFDLYNTEVQQSIYNVRPGITGIGSIIFRDEERIISSSKDIKLAYKEIFQYKGELEMWYQKNISFLTDCKIVFLTALGIFFPHNKMVFKSFPSLPYRSF